MDMQGILIKDKNLLYLEVEGGDRYSINSITDAHKVQKLDAGTILNGTTRKYHPRQIELLGWTDRVGSIEPGHLHVGVLKQRCT